MASTNPIDDFQGKLYNSLPEITDGNTIIDGIELRVNALIDQLKPGQPDSEISRIRKEFEREVKDFTNTKEGLTKSVQTISSLWGKIPKTVKEKTPDAQFLGSSVSDLEDQSSKLEKRLAEMKNRFETTFQELAKGTGAPPTKGPTPPPTKGPTPPPTRKPTPPPGLPPISTTRLPPIKGASGLPPLPPLLTRGGPTRPSPLAPRPSLPPEMQIRNALTNVEGMQQRINGATSPDDLNKIQIEMTLIKSLMEDTKIPIEERKKLSAAFNKEEKNINEAFAAKKASLSASAAPKTKPSPPPISTKGTGPGPKDLNLINTAADRIKRAKNEESLKKIEDDIFSLFGTSVPVERLDDIFTQIEERRLALAKPSVDKPNIEKPSVDKPKPQPPTLGPVPKEFDALNKEIASWKVEDFRTLGQKIDAAFEKFEKDNPKPNQKQLEDIDNSLLQAIRNRYDSIPAKDLSIPIFHLFTSTIMSTRALVDSTLSKGIDQLRNDFQKKLDDSSKPASATKVTPSTVAPPPVTPLNIPAAMESLNKTIGTLKKPMNFDIDNTYAKPNISQVRNERNRVVKNKSQADIDAFDKAILESLDKQIDTLRVGDLESTIQNLSKFRLSDTFNNGIDQIIKKYISKAEAEVKKYRQEMEKAKKEHPSSDTQANELMSKLRAGFNEVTGITGRDSNSPPQFVLVGVELRALQDEINAIENQWKSSKISVISPKVLAAAEKELSVIREGISRLPRQFNTLNDFVNYSIVARSVNAQIEEFRYRYAQILDLRKSAQSTVPYKNDFDQVTRPLNRLDESFGFEISKVLNAECAAVNMGGKGDCLFLSLTRSDKFDDGKKMREQIVAHMKLDPTRYIPLIEARLKDMSDDQIQGFMKRFNVNLKEGSEVWFPKYLTWMSEDFSWGGKAEIQAYSDLNHVPVIARQTVRSGRADEVIIPLSGEGGTPFLLWNQGASHFVPVFPKKEAEEVAKAHGRGVTQLR